MTVIMVCGSIPGYDSGIVSVMKIIENTLNELGVNTELINVSDMDIHYFDGDKMTAVENVFNKINAADGAIFGFNAVLSAPCAIMQTFIEHFNFNIYTNFIDGKKCLAVASSQDGSERKACDYLLDIITKFGGIDAGKVAVGAEYIGELENRGVLEIIEKYAEDYYRLIRQERKFLQHKPNMGIKTNVKNTNKNSSAKKKIKVENLLEQIDFTSFNEQQEQEINEITKILSSQYKKSSGKQASVSDMYKKNSDGFKKSDVVAHIETIRQKTKSLPHYFQPQLAGELEAVIQINIKGNDKFEGYIEIKNGKCDYKEGIHETPDVTVFSDENVWDDVLNGRYTTQKAFMVGQLKVRGNFVLLTRFDQLFKINE